MQIFSDSDFTVRVRDGIVSRYLLTSGNAPASRATITQISVPSNASQDRHLHERSEQIWVALEGCGNLLLADGGTRLLKAGEIARFGEGVIHGVTNSESGAFVYMSITIPPL